MGAVCWVEVEALGDGLVTEGGVVQHLEMCLYLLKRKCAYGSNRNIT